MEQRGKLKLNCMAIGSLPHKDVMSAMQTVEENFTDVPFWPQLAKLNKNEDMILQFLENMPGIVKTEEKIYLENESDDFFEKLEEFFMDYEEVIQNKNDEILEKYAVTDEYSSSFKPFLDIIKKTNPPYAKGQIVGPFTLATSLNDKEGKCAFYDETLREIIVKTLTLKALWQINHIRKANRETIPIIFIDEPSISQLGTSAFVTIQREEVIGVIKEISDSIKSNNALSAIHCCGKSDWTVLIDSGVDIINLDAYFFAQNLSIFANEVKAFLEKGGIIAWGIVPTLDKEALENADANVIVAKFDEAIEYLIKKGVDKNLLINNSMITPSCGAGSLNIELAQKAMKLTHDVSLKLKEKFS